MPSRSICPRNTRKYTEESVLPIEPSDMDCGDPAPLSTARLVTPPILKWFFRHREHRVPIPECTEPNPSHAISDGLRSVNSGSELRLGSVTNPKRIPLATFSPKAPAPLYSGSKCRSLLLSRHSQQATADAGDGSTECPDPQKNRRHFRSTHHSLALTGRSPINLW